MQMDRQRLVETIAYNERFNGTLCHEVLNAEWFTTTMQVTKAKKPALEWFAKRRKNETNHLPDLQNLPDDSATRA